MAEQSGLRIVGAADMRAVEKRSEEAGTSTADLMQKAGEAIVTAIENYYEDLDEANILVLAGPGNNGGDALVAASLLRDVGDDTEVQVFFYKRARFKAGGAPVGGSGGGGKPGRGPGGGPGNRAPRPLNAPPPGFPEGLTFTQAESQSGLELTEQRGWQQFREMLPDADIVIDGVFGAGLNRAVESELARAIDLINTERETRRIAGKTLFVVAIDVPSGLNSDTGEAMGSTLRVDITVTLGLPKTGLFAYPAAEYVGKIIVGDIGLPPAAIAAAPDTQPEMISADWVRAHLPARPRTGHKGTFGKLMVISGSQDYLGAPYLATAAAMRTGAGLVTLAAPRSLQTLLAARMVENTLFTLPEPDIADYATTMVEALRGKLDGYRAVLLGPGLGHEPQKIEFVRLLLENGILKGKRLVIDADGLNALAEIDQWWTHLEPQQAIITPHPAELGRLRQMSVADIEKDRQKSARDSAALFGQIVILKGAYSLVATPDGGLRLNPGANAAMATAGSGDVLAGICAGLLCQTLPPDVQSDATPRPATLATFDAASVGAYLHSMAGELVRRQYGDMGVLAGDFLLSIPQAVQALNDGEALER